MKKVLQLSLLLMTTFSFGQTPISIFNFENTMSNTTNTSTFVGLGANQATNTNFGNDRAGRANAALVCTGGGTSYQATIANLPTGNTARTISFWFRSDNIGLDQHIFSYGASTTNQAHGYSIYWSNPGGNTSSYYGFGNDMNNNIPVNAYGQGTWHLYVCVFDGTTATVYRNGNVFATSNRSGWNTFASNVFGLGRLINGTAGFVGAIDDLKIYNVALTNTQIVAINNHRAADVRASATLARETNITTSSVSLNYRVDAGNLPTNLSLNYGTTAGNLTNSVAISSNLVNSALTESNYTLTGLSPDTVYYYTLTAQNESGSTVLAERSFRSAANFPLTGLIAYFPFENGLSSHDNSHSFTTLSVTAPTFATGQVGNGIMFNNDTATGNSTAIVNDATISTALNQFNEYSVAFWVDNMVSASREPYPTFVEMFASIFVRQDLFASTTAINRGYANPNNQFFTSNTSPDINTGLQHIALVHKAGSGSDRINCALYLKILFLILPPSLNLKNTIQKFLLVLDLHHRVEKTQANALEV
jgi:Concanavalin A-like lectin/glucanases superfamily